MTPAVEHKIPVAWINRKRERPTGAARPDREFGTLTELADWLARKEAPLLSCGGPIGPTVDATVRALTVADELTLRLAGMGPDRPVLDGGNITKR